MGVERAVMRTIRGAVAGAVTLVVLAGACSGSKRDVAAPPTSTTTTAVSTPVTEAPTTTTVAARPAPSGPHTLTAFTSCTSLLRHLKREAVKAVTPWGLPGMHRLGRGVVQADALSATSGGDGAAAPSSAPAASAGGSGGGPSFSGTNIQEEGVDEPDIVKTDGRRLVTVVDGSLKIVDLTSANPVVLGSMALPQEGGSSPELLLVGDRVLLFSIVYDRQSTSVMRVIDIANPAKPAEVATMKLDGAYVSARLAAGVVRLVVTHDPKGPQFAEVTHDGYGVVDEAGLLEANKQVIRRSTIKDWLPTYEVSKPGAKTVQAPLVPCASVLRPKEFAGLSAVSVLTIDPADPKPGSVACVLGGGRIVYASPQNLYVATERFATIPWEARNNGIVDSRALPETVPSQIHQFAIPGREPAVYVGSGEVVGSLLNQFSMSEHDGHLRVATTVRGIRGDVVDNIVHALRAEGGRLVQVGTLGKLGHEGETIQSVRFLGTRGYVVTFRQTDPLYVIDLRDPRRPKTLGELQVPGFSSYLHPLSETALLGVGQGPDDQGGQGLQVSLFDVGDPARPVRLDNKVFSGYSSAQHDHHAFLWWAPAGKLVLPYQGFGGRSEVENGALVLAIDPAKGFGASKVLAHYQPVTRAMVSEGRLLTLSDDGILSNDIATLAERSRTRW